MKTELTYNYTIKFCKLKNFYIYFLIKIIIQKLWHLDFLYTYCTYRYIRTYLDMTKHNFEYSELYEFTSARHNEKKCKAWVKLVMDFYFLPEFKSGQVLFVLFVTCRSSLIQVHLILEVFHCSALFSKKKTVQIYYYIFIMRKFLTCRTMYPDPIPRRTPCPHHWLILRQNDSLSRLIK